MILFAFGIRQDPFSVKQLFIVQFRYDSSCFHPSPAELQFCLRYYSLRFMLYRFGYFNPNDVEFIASFKAL